MAPVLRIIPLRILSHFRTHYSLSAPPILLPSFVFAPPLLARAISSRSSSLVLPLFAQRSFAASSPSTRLPAVPALSLVGTTPETFPNNFTSSTALQPSAKSAPTPGAGLSSPSANTPSSGIDKSAVSALIAISPDAASAPLLQLTVAILENRPDLGRIQDELLRSSQHALQNLPQCPKDGAFLIWYVY